MLHTISVQPRHRKALANWTALNAYLLTAGIEDCRLLIKMETATEGHLARPTFVKRIWGRYNKMKKLAMRRGR